ncbi:MAG: IPT/TIG domain-containing protein [Patescibacteria group bacterium]
MRIDYVYPSEVTTEGKQQITIYGAGFVRETKVFIQSPEMIRIEAFVFNPGYLQTWMPSWPAGHYILGVINPDGSQAKWSGVLNYTEKKD